MTISARNTENAYPEMVTLTGSISGRVFFESQPEIGKIVKIMKLAFQAFEKADLGSFQNDNSEHLTISVDHFCKWNGQKWSK